MASFDPFEDMKKDLSDQWQNHTNNLFPVNTIVKQVVLDNLIEKMPKKFQHKSEDYAQKSVCKKKSKVDKSHHRDIVTKHLALESSDHAKAQAIQDYLVNKWSLKVD